VGTPPPTGGVITDGEPPVPWGFEGPPPGTGGIPPVIDIPFPIPGGPTAPGPHEPGGDVPYGAYGPYVTVTGKTIYTIHEFTDPIRPNRFTFTELTDGNIRVYDSFSGGTYYTQIWSQVTVRTHFFHVGDKIGIKPGEEVWTVMWIDTDGWLYGIRKQSRFGAADITEPIDAFDATYRGYPVWQ